MKKFIKILLIITIGIVIFSCNNSKTNTKTEKVSNSKYSNIVGVYKSTFSSSFGYFDGTTTLTTDVDGHLKGKYEMIMGKRHVKGTILGFNQTADNTFECTWKGEKRGEGTLKITFNDTFTEFKGVWGKADGGDKYVWDGIKK